MTIKTIKCPCCGVVTITKNEYYCPCCHLPNPIYEGQEDINLIENNSENEKVVLYQLILNLYYELEKELVELEQEHSQLEDEIAQIKKQIETYTEQLERVRSACDNNQNVKLNSKVQQLKKQIKEVNRDKRKVQRLFSNLSNEFAPIKKFLCRLQINSYTKQETEYISQLKELSQTVKLLLEENPDTLRETNMLKEEQKDVKEKLASLELELNEKVRKIDNVNYNIGKRYTFIEPLYIELLAEEIQLSMQGEEVESIKEKVKKLGEYPTK